MTESVHRYEPDALAAVYRVIHERRDVRHFLPLPIDPLAELVYENGWPQTASEI
jgi:hypothetical protein